MTTSPLPAAATISASMTNDQRHEATRTLASGTRDVRILGDWRTLQTGDASWGQNGGRLLGEVSTTWRTGVVTATRRPVKGDQYSPFYGGRSYPTNFEGHVIEDGAAIVGTVTTEVRRYNRFALPGAIFLGVVIGAGLGYGEKNMLLGIFLAVVVFAFFFGTRGITRGREARILVKDLERIATTFTEGIAYFTSSHDEGSAER